MGKTVDIAAYIESGILELYVAGVLSAEEAAEVSATSRQYPEIAAEIAMIEKSVQAYASSYAPTDHDASGILASAMMAIERESQSHPEADAAAATEEATLRPLHEPRRFRPWMIAAAGLLLISLAVNLWLFFRWQETDQRLATLIAERDMVAQQRDDLLVRYHSTEEMLAHLQAPSSQSVRLAGTDLSQSSKLRLVYNPETQRLLAGDLSGLPEPPSNKQYQLWAIIEGKPVDAGVLDYQPDAPQWAKTIEGEPAAFAITLEPRGGSVEPTLDQMYVIGEAS